MQAYIALIRKEAETSYGVDFPDLPGLVSGGETLEDAMRNANEALALHIEGLVEDGDAIPKPSALDQIMEDPDNHGAVGVLVNAPIQKGKAVRVNLTFDENLLARIDQAASEDGTGRSGWLAMLARQRLEGTGLMVASARGTRIEHQQAKGVIINRIIKDRKRDDETPQGGVVISRRLRPARKPAKDRA